MYLAAEGQEQDIADAAAQMLAETMPIARLQHGGAADLSAEQRRALAELGWFGLAVPEDRGGSGLSEIEHALFFREVGRHCGPLDVLAQCLAAHAANDDALRGAILAGDAAAALVIDDRGAFRMIGAEHATVGVLVTPTRATLIPLGALVASPRPFLDPANSMRRIAALPDPIGATASDRGWVLGQLAVSAMLIGLAEAALDLIVDYARIRETFGRKIGAYQAVRHPCADMAVRLEAARAQVWYAAAASKERHDDAAVHRAAAKTLANMAALANCDTTIQLHGGIGVTYEHDAHFLLKHALVLSRLFGAKRPLLTQLLHARLKD